MRELAAKRFSLKLSLVAGLFAPGIGVYAQTNPAAPAQAPAAGQLQSVTVSAERREENLRNVPCRHRSSAMKRSMYSIPAVRICKCWLAGYRA